MVDPVPGRDAGPGGPLQPRLASPRALDPSLYLVTDTARCRPRRVADVVAEAVEVGVSAGQVRDETASDRGLLASVLAVRATLEATPHVGLAVNDAVDVAIRAGADKVHVGRHDLPPEAVRALVGPRVHVGRSAGTEDEATTGLGLDRLAAAAARLHERGLQAAGIGGIDASRSAGVRAGGVDGLCVASAVGASPDPRPAASRLVDPARAQR